MSLVPSASKPASVPFDIKFNGPCWSYSLITQWGFDATETDGMVIQKVTTTSDVKDCVNQMPVLAFGQRFCALPVACKNKIQSCPENTYYELWRRFGTGVYSADLWAKNPTKAPSKGGLNLDLDIFAHAGIGAAGGCPINSAYGFEEKTGEALFVPFSALGDPKISTSLIFRMSIQLGKGGVAAACMLTSACHSKAFAKLWDDLQAVATSKTNKRTLKMFNCCDAAHRDLSFVFDIDDKPEVVGPKFIPGEPPDAGDAAIWATLSDC